MTLARWSLLFLLLCALGRVPLEAAGYGGRVVLGALPVPGATVTASRGDRQVSTVTDEQGLFTFADLDTGVWRIRVEMLAFDPIVRDVTIGGPDAAVASWALTAKSIDEIAREPSTVIVAAPARVSAARPAVTPDASAKPTAAAAVPADDAPPADSSSDGFLVNGSVNNSGASSVAQAPAFGNNRRRPGAVYNGGLSFVAGTSALDARSFTFAGVTPVEPAYSNVRIGGTFGGPIRVSRVPQHNPNIFLSVQHSDDHNATTQSGVVPTALERAGDFSQSRDAAGQPVTIVDPATGRPFAGDVVPAQRITPQAAALLRLFPAPNVDGAGVNFQAALLNGTTQNQVSTRVTQLLSTDSQLIGLLAYQRTSARQTTMFGFTDASASSGLDTSVALMHRITRAWSMRVRYQFTGVTNSATPYFANRQNVSGDAGITGNSQDPADWGPPSLQFTTVTALTDALPAFTRTDTHNSGVEAYWSRGHHNLTLGGDLRRTLTAVRSQQNPRGALTFTGAATGSDLADFLLGLPATSAIAFGNADKDFRAVASDAYLTDDWRLSPTLTIQLGARWEYETPPAEALGRLVNLDVAPDFSAVSPVTAGGKGALTGRTYPAGLIHPDRAGLQPRLGLAWRPIPGSSLLVRAGYGLYRNGSVYQPIALLLAQQPLLSKAFTASNDPAHPFTLADAFTAPAAAAGNTFAVDPDLRVSTSQNWQAMVQRDLPGSLTVTASYLGTKGGHLWQELLPNTYPAGAANPCPTCPAGFIYLTSNGRSWRHAAQFQVRRRLRNGLAASVQYTLAKAMDDAPAFTGVSLAGGAVAQDWLDSGAEWARSNFDQRHQVAVQVQYTTGLGAGALLDGMKGRLIKGWTATAQLSAGSGLPFTPEYLAPVPGTGVVGSLRPMLTGATVTAPDGYYLNPAAYAVPAAGQWGNAGRNSVTGPAQFSLDASVARTFQVSSRLTLDWRIDATNVLNRETYTAVNAVLGSPQFGLPSVTSTPRRVLSTMRLRF